MALLLFIASFIGFGFYAMEIEDHHGDLQTIFYKSKTGDIILNESNKEIGLVDKDWTRITVVSDDSTDLYHWVYRNGGNPIIKIYRPRKNLNDLKVLTYDRLKIGITKSEFELITDNKGF